MADPTFDLDAAVREANPEPAFDLDAAVREAGIDPREAEAAGLAAKKYAQNTVAMTDAEVDQLGAQAYTEALARGESEESAAAEERRVKAPFAVLSGERAAEAPTGSLYDTVTKGAIPVGESATERDQRWRDIARQSSVATLGGVFSGTAGAPSAEEVKAAGLDIPWTDKAERLTEKVLLAPGSPIATAVAAFGGDTYGVPTFNDIGAMGQEALDLASEYGADPGVQRAVSPEEWFGVKGATRLTARTGTLVAPYVQAAADKVADVQEAAFGDLAPEYIAKVRAFNAEQKQTLEDAVRIPAFDSAASALYLTNDRAALDSVPYRDLPPSMQSELPFTLMYSAVSPGGALEKSDGAAKLREGVARGASPVWLENEAGRLPIGLWREVAPDAVPSDAQVIEAHTRRQATQKMSGSEDVDGLLRVIGAGMIRRDNVDGQPVFVPSRMARVMAFGGVITEAVNEADIPLSWTPTVVGLAGGAKALGFDDFAKAVSEARIPTKAGWESWVATGTLNPYLEAAGYEGSRAPLLRPGQGTSWLGRVAADVAMPDYQGLGLTDALRRQGEAENSWIMDAAKAADVGYDFFLSPEDEVFHLIGLPMKGARRGWAAYNVAGEAGLRGVERAGVVGKAALGMDAAALHAAAKDAAKREVLRGAEMFSPMKPDGVFGKRTGQMTPYAQRAVADNIASVGVDPQEVFAAVNDIGARSRRMIVDDAAVMLARRGGPADVALRTSPEYRAVKDAYVRGVRAGLWSQADADATMALLEANAWRRVEMGQIDDPVKAFAEQRVVLGGEAGEGAFLSREGDHDVHYSVEPAARRASPEPNVQAGGDSAAHGRLRGERGVDSGRRDRGVLTLHGNDPVAWESRKGFASRTGPTIHGSIEPTQAAWLIRYFQTADIRTILHENAHLLRFTMGDAWVDDLAKFFDHDANGLTRKGEEQFAEAMTRIWNYQIKPNGAFRAYADELTDTLSDLWMRVRGLPMGVPQGFRVWHDATLDPAGVLRDIAVAVNPDGVPRATPRVGTAANPYERAARETVKRRGALVQDVGVQRSVGEHIDALGLTRDQTTASALDLAASAIADHMVTSYRRMWGTQGDVSQVSSRAVVPTLRKAQVVESARQKMAAIFGGKAPNVTADAVLLTPEDAARMKVHVEWVANTGRGFETLNGPSGRDLLRPDRDFSTLTHGEYEAINDATLTLSAGPGSGRDVRAERVAGNFVVSAFAAGAAAASRNKQIKGIADTLKEWFVVNWKIAEYANPQIAEVSAESARLAGDISAWTLRTADRAKKLTPDAAVEQIIREVAKGAPAMPVQPEDVALLATLYDRYIPTKAGKRVEGLAEGMEEAPPATIGDLLHDLPDVTRLFARSTSASHDATEAEHGALVYLASIKDYDAAALTTEVRSQIEDALAVVHDGLRRRSEAVEHGGLQVALGFSGQPEVAVLAGLNADQARKTKWAMYQLWHQGRWIDIFAGNMTTKGVTDAIPYLSGGVLAANMASKGFATAERSGFDQVSAALACVTRMRSQHILVETFERMMDLGIPLDVETAARAGRQFETIPLLGSNAVGRAAFREDVKHYLTAISNWSMTESTLFTSGGEYAGTIPSPSRVAPSGMFNPEAYQTATRILDAWGYRFGQDVVWTTTVLPNGVETFVPSEWLGEIEGAIDRGAKAGLAWTAAADDPSKVLGALTPGGVQHRLSVGGRVKAAVAVKARDLSRASTALPTALGRGVATVLSSALDGLGFVYATSRIGMTTGFLMPHPANYVGNTFGGLLQMLAGKGALETTSALATYVRGGPRADYLRQLFLRTFRDTRGAPFSSIWERKGAVWLDGRGAIHSVDDIGDDIARLGLRSSMAHAESGVKLLEAVKEMDGTFWHRITHDPLLETFVKKPVRYWQSVLTEISGATDNFYRCAAYVDELARGATKEEAAAVARRVAFDYGAATEFEKETLRPIVMFYMYQRRNVDLFWWTLLNRPSRVLGTVQGIRKLQQYILGDDSELVWPEYLGPRGVGMFRAVGVDSPMADSRKGVATVLPPFPTMDALGLHIRLWSVLNGEPEGMRETFSMLSPFAQAMVVLGLRKNPYSDRDIEREATIPQWFMDIDYHLTGGHVVNDVFGARWEAVPDPEMDIEGEYNTGRWMAKNAGAWWTARTLFQIPPFGRAMDTISKMNQADSLAWAFPGGFITAAEKIGPLAEPVPEIAEQMEAIGATPVGLRRTGVTEGEETANALGFKTIPVDTEAMGVARKEADRARKVREAQKEEERGAPHRYGR